MVDGVQQLRRRLGLAADRVIFFGVYATTTTAAEIGPTLTSLQRCRGIVGIAVLAEAGAQIPGAEVVPVSGRLAAIRALLDLAQAPMVGFIEAGARVSPGSIERMVHALGRGIAVVGPSTNRASGQQGRPDAPADGASDAELGRFMRHLAIRARAGVREVMPVTAVDPFCWLARRKLVSVTDLGVHPHRSGAAWVTTAYVHRRPPQVPTPVTFTATRPLVSCILPTRNRPRFVIEAVRNFLAQDYPERELVVVDDGETPIACLLPDDRRIVYVRATGRLTIGDKRNLACTRARGSIIAHLDDDDWYPPTRLSTQVHALCEEGADVVGSSDLHVIDLHSQREWHLAHPHTGWVAGTTLVYRRELWQAHPFAPVTVGEDTRFLAAASHVVDLRDPRLCVVTVHGHNTTTVYPTDGLWRPGTGQARALLGDRHAAYVEAADATTVPLVSCVMPTHDRPAFVALAIASFEAQSYPMKELIVMDDGRRPVANLVRGRSDIRYRRLAGSHTIGAKRNAGQALARGSLLCSWDDDDWYASDRLRYQLLPILYGDADITGLESAFMMDLTTGEVWAASDSLHETMFAGNVAGGTLAYRRTVGDRVRFPDTSLAEDAAWLRNSLAQGFRLARLANAGLFIYMRHGHNTWRFHAGTFMDARGWHQVAPPPGFDAAASYAYRAAAS
jgi:glycosyltransferase involved in cell wall biosynthesis